MLKKLILPALLVSMFFSCKNDEEIKKLNDEKAQLERQLTQRDSSLNGYLKDLNDIETNLSEVTRKENTIRLSAKGGEMKEDAKTRIQEDIQAINDLMAKNKRSIDSLKNKLKKAGVKMSEFKKMIARLNQQIAERDSTINSLKEQLVSLNFKIESLNSRLDTITRESSDRANRISQQTNQINTAYYIMGTYKELKKTGILSKEGSIIGIGGSAKLKQDFNVDNFTQIDITKTKTFSIGGKKAKFATTHPAGTYKWEGTDKKVDNLVITDPEKFWKVSKYMVIIID